MPSQRHVVVAVIIEQSWQCPRRHSSNPVGGDRRARQTFEVDVRPVLRAAGLEVVAQETQHAGHASQMTADMDLQRMSVLVMVGGDGTVFEALQARALVILSVQSQSILTHT